MDNYINVGIVQADESIFNLSRYIDNTSFSFGVSPRQMQIIRTLDGIDHVAGGGYRQTLKFKFNPMTASTAMVVLRKLFESAAFAVSFNGLLPPEQGLYYNMRLSDVSMEYLSRCRFCADKWFQFGEIELIEL